MILYCSARTLDGVGYYFEFRVKAEVAVAVKSVRAIDLPAINELLADIFVGRL